MKSYNLLSIDETGKASYKHPSQLFIVSGVLIPERLKKKIDSETRKIKKKYFKNPDIVFHTRDMIRAKGQFANLKDQAVAVNFWTEFTTIINNPAINLFFIITNKEHAKKAGWQSHTILEKMYIKLLEGFIQQLMVSNSYGKILLESDPAQDTYLIKAHNRLQSIGTTDKRVDAKEYRTRVTSLSLVNKENLDIDIQIADALAPIAGLKYQIDILKLTKKPNTLEQMKLDIINKKIIDKKNLSLFEVLI